MGPRSGGLPPGPDPEQGRRPAPARLPPGPGPGLLRGRGAPRPAARDCPPASPPAPAGTRGTLTSGAAARSCSPAAKSRRQAPGAARGPGWRGRGGAGGPGRLQLSVRARRRRQPGAEQPLRGAGAGRGGEGAARSGGRARPSGWEGGGRGRGGGAPRAPPALPAAGPPRGLRGSQGRSFSRSSRVRDRAAPNGRPGRGAGGRGLRGDGLVPRPPRAPLGPFLPGGVTSGGGVASLRRRPALGSPSRPPPEASPPSLPAWRSPGSSGLVGGGGGWRRGTGDAGLF